MVGYVTSDIRGYHYHTDNFANTYGELRELTPYKWIQVGLIYQVRLVSSIHLPSPYPAQDTPAEHDVCLMTQIYAVWWDFS